MYTLQLMLVGRILTDGRLNARVKCDLTENLTMKINAQVYGVILDGWILFGDLLYMFVILYNPHT